MNFTTGRFCHLVLVVLIFCGQATPFLLNSPSPSSKFSPLSFHSLPWTKSLAFQQQLQLQRHPKIRSILPPNVAVTSDDSDEKDSQILTTSNTPSFISEKRRFLVSSFGQVLLSAMILVPSSATAAAISTMPLIPFSSISPRRRRRTNYIMDPKNDTESLRTEPVAEAEPALLNAELCLLQLLPVKQSVFRQLQAYVSSLSTLQNKESDEERWKRAQKTMQETLQYLDNQRSLLQPVFNQDENTLLQITKGERYEQLVERLRFEILDLAAATKERNATRTFREQKEALMALANMGELMVSTFPYDVPQAGKFSFLPRLLGRARVTFTFKRKFTTLGNVTIIADGFAAPITAGNFVDLCIRNFYTGLPVKIENKRFEGRNGDKSVVAALPMLGSYNEGFIDPLTARPRRIPLEIVSMGKSTGLSKLSYADGFTDLSSEASLEPQRNNKPVLSFAVPGLVALNHPAKNVNGGSSEFFCLREDTLPDEDKSLLDGEYAPFGYVVEGLDLFRSLQVGDVIDSTNVGEWGVLNLVKIRGTRFSDMQGSDEET